MKIKGNFAKNYDRFVKRSSILPQGLLELIKSTGAKNILEFACGTGTVAIGLSLEGYNVIGVDHSLDMLKTARRKALNNKVIIEFILADISKVRLDREFDLILCLGNSIPFFTTSGRLKKLLVNCRRHLNDGGILVFQQLNYDRILHDRPGTFAIDVDNEIARFKQYRYGKRLIDFIVTMADGTRIPPRQTSTVSRLKPWTRNEIKAIVRDSGFKNIHFYGDYSKSKFTLKSKDLVLFASK